MSNYYSTVEVKDGKFIGTVYIESSNQLVYQTSPHTTQTQALDDIGVFIRTNKPPETPIPTQPPRILTQTITNTVRSHTNVPLPTVRGRCCGR